MRLIGLAVVLTIDLILSTPLAVGAHNSSQDRRGRYTSAYETIPGMAFAARQNMEMPT
jgi:hypothetical protein